MNDNKTSNINPYTASMFGDLCITVVICVLIWKGC